MKIFMKILITIVILILSYKFIDKIIIDNAVDKPEDIRLMYFVAILATNIITAAIIKLKENFIKEKYFENI